MTFVYNHTSNFCSSQIDDHGQEDLSESEHDQGTATRARCFGGRAFNSIAHLEISPGATCRGGKRRGGGVIYWN